LKHDQRAEIVTLDEAVQGFTRRRFLDLGMTPGTEIYPELQNFLRRPAWLSRARHPDRAAQRPGRADLGKTRIIDVVASARYEAISLVEQGIASTGKPPSRNDIEEN